MAIVERFVTASAAGSKDGKDTTGFNLTSCTWTYSTKTLVKTNGFSSYTVSSETTDYIYISSATAGTNGVYTVASKTDNSTIVLGTLISGAGVGSDQTDVATGTGPYTLTEGLTSANVTAGTRVNIRAKLSAESAYAARTASDSMTSAGTSTSPCIWRGYKVSIGDGYQGRSENGTGALITTNMPTWHYNNPYQLTYSSGGAFWIFDSLNLTGAYSLGFLSPPGNTLMLNSKFDNLYNGSGAARGISCASSNAAIINCDVILSGSTQGAANAAALYGYSAKYIIGCHVFGGIQGSGILVASNAAIIGCIISGVPYGILIIDSATFAGLIFNCTIVDCGYSGVSGCAGIKFLASTTTTPCVIGCRITDTVGTTGYAFNAGGSDLGLFSARNRILRNTSGECNQTLDWLTATKFDQVDGDSWTRANEYIAPDSKDYRLPGMSVPGVGVGSKPYKDIGGLQRRDTPLPRSRIVNGM